MQFLRIILFSTLALVFSLSSQRRTDIFGFKGRSRNVLNQAIFKTKEVYLKSNLRNIYSPVKAPKTLNQRRFFSQRAVVTSSPQATEISRQEILAVVGF